MDAIHRPNPRPTEAIATPSGVEVPRPSSSRTTSDRGVALARMLEVSSSSSRNVDRPAQARTHAVSCSGPSAHGYSVGAPAGCAPRVKSYKFLSVVLRCWSVRPTLGQGVGGAHAGEDCVRDMHTGRRGRHEAADLRHDRDERDLPDVARLACMRATWQRSFWSCLQPRVLSNAVLADLQHFMRHRWQTRSCLNTAACCSRHGSRGVLTAHVGAGDDLHTRARRSQVHIVRHHAAPQRVEHRVAALHDVYLQGH